MQRDMEYIRMVYKTGSFSKAAELLFASQPTVSLAVQRVEEELGVRLFERGTSPLRPTEAGKRYLAHADRIAQSDAQLRRELDGIHDRFREQLRLGCLPMHTQSLIPGFLARLAADHPDARVSAVSAFPSDLYRMLREGEVDLVICSMAGSNDVDIAYMPAVKEHLLAAVPPDDPLNERLRDFSLRFWKRRSRSCLVTCVRETASGTPDYCLTIIRAETLKVRNLLRCNGLRTFAQNA